MDLLVARDLELRSGERNLLRGGSLTLRRGWRVALVGHNGSGKSTLLQVLAGRRKPDGGTVVRPPGVSIGYLPQDPDIASDLTVLEAARASVGWLRELERELRAEELLLARGEGGLERYAAAHEAFERAGGYEAEGRMRELLAAFGLASSRFDEGASSLSGGERRRLALAALLAAPPNVLLLDEPSNDLDLPALRALAERLRSFSGALAFVSHDRALVDEVATHTGELRDGRLELRRGGFTALRERQGVRRRTTEKELRERRKEAERLSRTAEELRKWGTEKAQRRRRRAEREVDRLSGAEGVEDSRPRAVPEAREASGLLLEARALVKQHPAAPRVELGYARIEAGDKIVVLGPNGSGKSTLLGLLAADLPSDDPAGDIRWHPDAKVLYADQRFRGLDPELSALSALRSLVSEERARMLLALLRLPAERWDAPSGELSGGERARAAVAVMMAAEANLLLLDEPTNDLDIEGIELLHDALSGTEAAVVLVTHDWALAEVGRRVWSLEEGRVVEYMGGIGGYLAGRLRLAHDPGDPTAAPAPMVRRRGEEMEAEARANRTDTREGLPQEELERVEDELSAIDRKLEDPTSLSERELERLRSRRLHLIDDLSERYDARLPPPRPRFEVREGGLLLEGDRGPGGLRLHPPAPVEFRLLQHGDVAHLVMRVEEGHCLLPWARSALLDAAVRLTFYALAPRAVQHHSREPLHGGLLRPAEGGWWSLEREEFERIEGWRQRHATPGRNRRRLRRRKGRLGSRCRR